MDFMTCESDQQYFFDDQLYPELFNSADDITSQASMGPITWAWPGDPQLLPGREIVPSEALIQTAVEYQAAQGSESDIKRAVSELNDSSKELEDRMESRIAQFEERVIISQNE